MTDNGGFVIVIEPASKSLPHQTGAVPWVRLYRSTLIDEPHGGQT
ncbi:hypothetical protein RMSM_03550 [Rhodopirellula maiorica SM1]|uniref:Uncharacterized protein n=1 Tax=Rhodopirellula maiorica SM1 TaxID=1265738 RepID=M5S016_9BACT|nr:hypothetical protein RMSM_03550 [Rhodopirellula maiorica SM1]